MNGIQIGFHFSMFADKKRSPFQNHHKGDL